MDRFDICDLRAYYGALLTKTQNEILRLRFDEDMSFGEIADELGISRQSVLDAINKGVKHLEKFETSLGVMARDKSIFPLLEEIELSGNIDAAQAAKKIRDILEG